MAFRYPAGLITAGSPVTPEYPSGVWTNQQAAPYINGQVWANDPFFNQTVLLLHGDGTNGAQNNTFLDSSSNNFTITRNGNTTQGTFSPFSVPEGYWGNYFDGSGDYLAIPSDAAFTVGTGAVTIEAWIYCTSLSSTYQGIVSGRADVANAWNGLGLVIDNSKLMFTIMAYNNALTDTDNVPLNQWVHVVGVRNGSSNAALFVNGVRKVYNASFTENGTSSAMNIGRYYPATNNYYFTGYMSGVRIVKGYAEYDPTQTTITVPTSPFTAVTGTSLLTCQSNRFIDNSTNNFTVTRVGDVRVTPFDPFLPTGAYSPSVTGGSGYFDGSGDYLSVPASAQFLPGVNTDFTFEAWVYLTATPGAQGAQIVGTGEYGLNADWSISVNSSRLPFFYINVPPGGLFVTSSTAINLFSWNHIAVTRSGTGSNNLKMFLNGVNVGQTSTNITLDYNGNNLALGADENGDESVLTGYISGLRLINGTGYTSITEPTAPPIAITNTVLLTNFTNAGILDNTMFNNLETIGNAQIDTTTKKYGTGSMEFDGSGDYLRAAANPALSLGSGDFTVEGWLYLTSSAADSWFYDGRRLSVDNTTGITIVYRTSGGNITVGSQGATYITSSSSISTSQWYHIAVVRNSGTLTLYIDGVSEGTASHTVDLTSEDISIGTNRAGTTNLSGYIDDLRITKGVARYTTNFTPPIARFPNQ